MLAELARWFLERDELDYVIACCSEALEVDPKRHDVKLMLKHALPEYAKRQFEAEMFDDALSTFEQAIEAGNDGAGLLLLLAKCYRGKGDREGTREAYLRYLNSPFADRSVGLFEVARAEMQLERSSEARGYLEELISLRPTWASAWYEYGRALRRLREFSQAVEAFERCLALDPDHKKAASFLKRTQPRAVGNS